MKATTTKGIFILGLVMLYFTGLPVALGQAKERSRGVAAKRTAKERQKKDSIRAGEEQRGARSEAKETYKKSKVALIEAARKNHQISWEQGKVSSTFPESAKDLKQVNQEAITRYRNKPLKEGGRKRLMSSGEGGFKKPGKTGEKPGKGMTPVAGIAKKAENKPFKKYQTKAQYLDSLQHLSELINRQESASLEQGQLPSWVDRDMMSKSKTRGGQVMRVRSDKTRHQIEDSLNRYFPARRLLSIAQKKEEISPSDFVNLLGEQKEQKNIPSTEGEARSAVMASAKEEVKDIGSYRLPEEHLATLKTLQARQMGQLPQEVLDSVRKTGLRKNRVKMKEVPQSKTEVLHKIREKGRLRHRFFFEGILGGFSSDFTTFQLSPALGFKVFRTYSIGVGPMLSISRNGWNTTCDIRMFMKKEFFHQRCYLQLEDILHPYSREKGYSITQTLYAGAGYVLHISRMANLNVMGMYQIGGAKTGQPLIFRVGFSIINQ